jgi:anti-sigma factor RsiW
LAALHPEDLSDEQRAELAAHLATCARCTAALADYQTLAEQLRQLPERAAQQTLPPQLHTLWNESPAREENEGRS